MPVLSAFNHNLQKAPSAPIKTASSILLVRTQTSVLNRKTLSLSQTSLSNKMIVESDTDWYRQTQSSSGDQVQLIIRIIKDNDKYYIIIGGIIWILVISLYKSQALSFPCPILYLHALWKGQQNQCLRISMPTWNLVLFKHVFYGKASATFSGRSLCSHIIESHTSQRYQSTSTCD